MILTPKERAVERERAKTAVRYAHERCMIYSDRFSVGRVKAEQQFTEALERYAAAERAEPVELLGEVFGTVRNTLRTGKSPEIQRDEVREFIEGITKRVRKVIGDKGGKT